MNTTHRRTVLTALAAVMLWVAALPMAIAQDRSLGSAVIYPIVFGKGTGSETSRQTGVRSVREVLQKAGYTLISSTVAANAWRKMGLTLPSVDNMIWMNILHHANVGKQQRDNDAETTPLRHPELYQYDLNLPDIADKMLSALRHGFGGHEEKPAPKGGD